MGKLDEISDKRELRPDGMPSGFGFEVIADFVESLGILREPIYRSF